MEIEAAPQPFFSCLTNGTSSQTPGGPFAPAREKTARERAENLATSRVITSHLSSGHDDDDDQGGCYSDNDIGELLIGKTTRGKLVLDLVGTSG